MKFVKWQLLNLTVPMIETEDGRTYCTSGVLCSVLGLTPAVLERHRLAHKDEVRPATVGACQALEFLHEEIGGEVITQETLLWGVEDAVHVALTATSVVSSKFRKQFIELVQPLN